MTVIVENPLRPKHAAHAMNTPESFQIIILLHALQNNRCDKHKLHKKSLKKRSFHKSDSLPVKSFILDDFKKEMKRRINRPEKTHKTKQNHAHKLDYLKICHIMYIDILYVGLLGDCHCNFRLVSGKNASI